MSRASHVSNAPLDLTSVVNGDQSRIEFDLQVWLNKFVIGQDHAKKILIQTVINGLYNVCRDQWVLWAVFLAGPTGVGKTELARALAYVLLWDPYAITRISAENMNSSASINYLTGSAPGYVGYGDTPAMADTIVHSGYIQAKEGGKLHPILNEYGTENFSIVLVDEIEKADRSIPLAFLWAIQSGEMQMSSGHESQGSTSGLKTIGGFRKNATHSRTTDLRNTLFIFTSNIGEQERVLSERKSIWFAPGKAGDSVSDQVFQNALKKAFPPEFIGRMDAVVRCHSLTQTQLRDVFNVHIARTNELLQKQWYNSGIKIQATAEYVDHILAGKTWEFGAREVTPAIKQLWAQVGIAYRSGKIRDQARGVFEFDYQNDAISLKFLEGADIATTAVKKDRTSPNPRLTAEATRNLVAQKINAHSNKVQMTVQSYLDLIARYDTAFADTCRILENKLRGFGFNTKELTKLQATAFVSVFQSLEQPTDGEIIVRDKNMFGNIGFRPVEKFLRNAISKNFSIAEMHSVIIALLGRLMTRNEAEVVSQHIHRILQGQAPVLGA